LKLFSKYRVPVSPEEKKQRKKEWLLLILSGIILGIAFPPFPFPVTLLIFVGLVPYLYVLNNRTGLASISRATFIFGFIFSLVTVYWVGSWQSEADPFLMAGGGAMLLALPCVLMIPSTLLFLTRKIFPKINAVWLFPLYWVTAEYLLTLTDLKFPWVTLGNGLTKFITFIQAAEFIGEFGFSLVVGFINVFLFFAFINYKKDKKKFYRNFSFGILLFLIFLTYGFVRKSDFNISNQKIRMGLIQPNIDPWKKWDVGNLNNLLDQYLGYSEEAVQKGAKVLVWPETALPAYVFGGSYQLLANRIHQFCDTNNVFLFTGMPDIRFYFDKEKMPEDAKFNKQGDYYYATYNAIMLITPGSNEIQKYGKMQLVPMGEKVPFVEQLKFLGDIFKWGVGITGWNVGKDTTVFNLSLNRKDSLKISGLICYESIFPAFVSAFAKQGAEMIVVVTNDSWYGKSSGPYQHKEYGVLRAIENRKSVVRCANGGISCVINAKGETEVESELFTKDVIVWDVPVQKEETFYSENPKIVSTLCSVFSLWIFGINILAWLKKKLKL
jgi:apolipoprotein N-acyltransferase